MQETPGTAFHHVAGLGKIPAIQSFPADEGHRSSDCPCVEDGGQIVSADTDAVTVHTVPDQLAGLGEAHDVIPAQIVNVHDHRVVLHPGAVVPVLDEEGPAAAGGLRQNGAAGTLFLLGKIPQFQNFIPAVQGHDGIQIHPAARRDAPGLRQLGGEIPFQKLQIQMAPFQNLLPGCGERLGKVALIALNAQMDQISRLGAVLHPPLKGIGRADFYTQEFSHKKAPLLQFILYCIISFFTVQLAAALCAAASC